MGRKQASVLFDGTVLKDFYLWLYVDALNIFASDIGRSVKDHTDNDNGILLLSDIGLFFPISSMQSFI